MRGWPKTRRTPLGLIGALVGSLVLSSGPQATAEPSLPELKEAAATLRAELNDLEIRQSLAVERFNQANEEVRQSTTAQVVANTDVVDRLRLTLAAKDRSARRIRALYQTGGPLVMSTSVLSSSSLDAAAARWHTVEALLHADSDQVLAEELQMQRNLQQAERISLSRAQILARKARAEQAAATVTQSIDARRALLQRTDARVIRLAEEQRRIAEARALAESRMAAQALGFGWADGDPGQQGALGRGLEGATASSQQVPAVAAPNGIASAAIQAAASKLGAPYRWGAVGPNQFDCSGLMLWAYAQAGVSLPRTSRAQFAGLPQVPLSSAMPGDLIFYAASPNDPGSIYHVGMYLGQGLSLYA
ncbi:MAG: NlpC/P60 family protein, partial [Angustibacter sp.]